MSSLPPVIESRPSAGVPRMTIEHPSRAAMFFGNLREVFVPGRFHALDLYSAPAEFWPDVFVDRPLPWWSFLQSLVGHGIAFGLLMVVTHLFSLQPRVVATTAFDRPQVVYYQPSEYLPPLDTREATQSESQKADPELSRQPIISVPAEADNSSQTVVAPPKVKLRREVALPNIVSWADQPEKPTLAIPPAPLTPAAERQRLAPNLEAPIVTPPPDAARLEQRRSSPALQSSVVAPPPDLRAANEPAYASGLQPALIAPPPVIERSSTRLGDLSIGHSAVIAPAPQLPMAEQRSVAGGRIAGMRPGAPQIVAPPPAISGSAGAGSPGRMIALNVHPAVGVPSEPAAGNRRGSFAATPDGRTGAAGTPGSTSGSGTATSSAKGNGTENGGSSRKKGGDLPAGLYVGSEAGKSSPVAGDPAGKRAASVNPDLLASARPPRVSASRAMQPESASKLSEPERAVFGNRKFYSVTLNMPNLNSAGGSWIIRFAEANHDSSPQDAKAPSADLSQPMATRKVDPAYPTQLMRQNVAGTVILYAVIHADGTVGSVRVLRSVDDRLDRYAADALTQWKFEPATKNGAAVDVEATFQIPFRPSRVASGF